MRAWHNQWFDPFASSKLETVEKWWELRMGGTQWKQRVFEYVSLRASWPWP